MTSRNRRQRPQDRCVRGHSLCFFGRGARIGGVTQLYAPCDAALSQLVLLRNLRRPIHVVRAAVARRFAQPRAFGPKWRKQLAGANAAAAGPSGWSEAPHACRAPAGRCTSTKWRAAAANERNHTTSENRRRNPPNLAHRLTAPETAVLRRERRSNVRGNERAGRREDAEPNARGSHTGR